MADQRSAYAAVVGQVIQALRRRADLSSTSLAWVTCISQSSISRYETGRSIPDVYDVRRLGFGLGLPPGVIVEMAERAFARATELGLTLEIGASWEAIDDQRLRGLAMLAAAIVVEGEHRG